MARRIKLPSCEPLMTSAAQFGSAFRAGRDLRFQVGDVLVGIARRPTPRGKERARFLVQKAPLIDEQYIVDQHAFFLDRGGARRRRR